MAETNLDILIKAKDQASAVVESLDDRINKLVQDLGAIRDNLNFEGGVNKFRELRGAAEDTSNSLNDAADSAEDLSNINLNQPISAFERLGQANDQLNIGLTAVANKLRSIGAALILFSAGTTATSVVAANSFLTFNEAIAEVSTLVDSAVISNQELENTVLELSNTLGIASVDVAAGLYTAISSGAAAGKDANELLNASLKLSVAGLVDANTAVNGVTTVINAFGLSTANAEQIADTLFVTMQNGKTTVGELSSFLFQAGPIAAALGISFEELSAAAGTLTLSGVPTAQAFTQIRAAIAGLSRPTEDLNKLFEDLGGAEQALADVGLAEVFNRVQEATGGSLGEIQKLVGSIEGANAILALGGQSAEEFQKQITDLSNSTGALQEGFDKVDAEPFRQLAAASNEVLNAFRELGRAVIPALVLIATTVGSIVGFVGDLARQFPTLTSVVVLGTVAFTALIGALLAFAVSTTAASIAFGILATRFPAVFTGITSVSGAILTFGGRLLSLIPGISAVTARLTTLRLALRSTFILGGVLLGVIGIASAMTELNETMAETEKLLDRNRRRLNDLVDNNVIRSTSRLVSEFKNLGDVSREEIIALEREINKRKEIVDTQINSTQKQIEATNNLTTQLFTDIDTDALQDQLDGFENKSQELEGVLAKLKTQLASTQIEVVELGKEAEEVEDIFDDLSSGVTSFIDDLKSINDVEFSGLEANIKRQGDLRLQLLEAGGASAGIIADAEADLSRRILIIKENEIRERLVLEQRRINEQKRLIGESAGDEEETAKRLQELASSSVNAQIRAASDLAGIRQESIAATEQQLAGLAEFAISSKQALEDELTSIDDKIREIELRSLTDQQRNAALATDIEKQQADVRTAIRLGEFNRARDLLTRLNELIIAQDVTPETSTGFLLESEAATGERTIGLLKEEKTLREDLQRAELSQTRTSAANASTTLEIQRQSLDNINAQITNLQGLSAEVNLNSNFSDQLGLIDQVSNSLSNLQGTAATVSLDVVVDNDVLNFLEGGVINIPVEGLNQLSNVADKFESASIRVLRETQKTLDKINALSSVASDTAQGFAGGGSVFGKGTGTSDSILARLSKGEFVMPANIVSRFGVGFFESLRRGKLPGFAEGGSVGVAPIPSSREDIVTVRLQLNRNSFDLKSDRDTAANLTQAFKNLESGLVGG